MNFATDTLKKSGLTAVDLERRTGIPREYFRRLRREEHVRRSNLNTKKGIFHNTRVFATDDTRWQQVATILLPESSENRQRFLDAVATLQGRRSPEDAVEGFGERKAMILTGRVEAVLVCDQEAQSTEQKEKIELFPDGVAGDRHTRPWRHLGVRDKVLTAFGLPKGVLLAPTRQVSIVSVEELQAIGKTLGTKKPIPHGALGENLVIAGIPRLTQLPPGTLLCFRKGGAPRTAVVAVWAENIPCIISGTEVQAATETENIAGRFVDVAMGRRGLVGFVMSSGVIKKGDEVVALIPAQRLYTP